MHPRELNPGSLFSVTKKVLRLVANYTVFSNLHNNEEQTMKSVKILTVRKKYFCLNTVYHSQVVTCRIIMAKINVKRN